MAALGGLPQGIRYFLRQPRARALAAAYLPDVGQHRVVFEKISGK